MAEDITSKSIYFYTRQMKISKSSFIHSTQLAGEQRCQFMENENS